MPLLKHPVGPAVVNVSERRAEVLRERGWTDPYDETEEVADEAEAAESVDSAEAEAVHEEEVAAQAEIEAELPE